MWHMLKQAQISWERNWWCVPTTRLRDWAFRFAGHMVGSTLSVHSSLVCVDVATSIGAGVCMLSWEFSLCRVENNLANGLVKWNDVGISASIWIRTCNLESKGTLAQKSHCSRWCVEENRSVVKHKVFGTGIKEEKGITYGIFSPTFK